VLVGALFAFITSFDELVVALSLSGSGAVTLPRRMWDDLRFQIDPTIAAVSTLTIVLTVALMASAHLLRRRTEVLADYFFVSALTALSVFSTCLSGLRSANA